MHLTGVLCFCEKVFDKSAHFPFITVVSRCESRLGGGEGGEGGGGGGEEEEEQELEPHSVLRPDTCSNLFLSFKFPIYFIHHVFGYIYVPKDDMCTMYTFMLHPLFCSSNLMKITNFSAVLL